MLTPYPLIYTPKGMKKPACCAHPAPASVYDGQGPDSVVDKDGVRSGGGGLCWGGLFNPALPWVKTRGGWWIVLDGHLPQHTRRIVTHPRILRWTAITGAQAEHVWRVPVLLTPTTEASGVAWLSACDRLFGSEGWRDADDLAVLQQPLLALASQVRQHQDEKANNAALTNLAIELLALGQWIDADLLVTANWLSESMVQRILVAALDRLPSHDPLHPHS